VELRNRALTRSLIPHVIYLRLLKDTKTAAHRTVRLLGPLGADLREWRLRSGRPGDDALVIPGRDGKPWSEEGYRSWRRQAFARAVRAAGIERRVRPYDCRHSFASLLLHEGRSVIYVARQLGHGAQLTLSTYGHVIDELEDAPRQDAEATIRAAREPGCSREVRGHGN
jgi:integrase